MAMRGGMLTACLMMANARFRSSALSDRCFRRGMRGRAGAIRPITAASTLSPTAPVGGSP